MITEEILGLWLSQISGNGAIYYEYLEAVNDEKITRIVLVDRNDEIVTSGDYSDIGKTFPEDYRPRMTPK